LSTVTRGTHLEDVVGVLPIGSKSGGVIKQIAALFDRGASSLLILADGADPQVVDHVALVGSLLSRWSSIVGAGARDVWPFRVLWVQRDARTGMDTWKRADPSVPHVVPDELEAAFRTELRGIQKVIVHLKPADKYLSWATWQALQQLADEQKLLVDSAYELSALNAPLIEQMKLQSGVANVDSTPLKGVRDVAGLPLDDLDRWLWQEALRAFGALGQRKPQPVCDALRRTPKYAAWRARNGLGKVDLEKDKAGDLLEHVLQVRLRMALSNAKSGILFDVQSADHQIDAVTAQAGTFVAWEAKCSPYKPKPAWRTTLTKAHRYTTCAPDRTHAVVVVPSIPPSISGHHVDEWGIHHIDFRVLGNEEALRTLATTGSLCGTNL
jgi:hypothetical protein